MVRFLDGPAIDATLMLRRAPVFLRVTIGAGQEIDALDQLDDEPRDGEEVFVYRKVPGTRGRVLMRPGGCYEIGDYRFMPDAPTSGLRDVAQWRAWVAATAAAEEDPQLPLLAEDTPAPQGPPEGGRSPRGG